MFLDLHEGILAEFAERQQLHRLRVDGVLLWRFSMAMVRCRETMERTRARRIRGLRTYQKREPARLRARRQPVEVSCPRPAVTFSTCVVCGTQVERRQGCRAPIPHRCRRPEAA